MKTQPWLLSPLLIFFIAGLVLGQTYPTNIGHRSRRWQRPSPPSPPQEQTYPTNIRYQSSWEEFPSLRNKIGSIIGIAPFRDDRSEKLYVGHQSGLRSVSNYFKSEPFPLEKAISDSLSQAVSRLGMKTVPIHDWDGKAESLKSMGVDSVLAIEITRFWTEGMAAGNATKVITSVYLTIRLGVKKEGRVFTKRAYVMKERTIPTLTPEEVERTLNRNLAGILDDFLFNPY